MPAFQICLYVCLSAYMSVCLSVCLLICVSAYLSVCLSACLPSCMFVCISGCLHICLSAYLSFCHLSLSSFLSAYLPACLPIPVCLYGSFSFSPLSLYVWLSLLSHMPNKRQSYSPPFLVSR